MWVKMSRGRFVRWTNSVGQNVTWSVCGWTDRQCTSTVSRPSGFIRQRVMSGGGFIGYMILSGGQVGLLGREPFEEAN